MLFVLEFFFVVNPLIKILLFIRVVYVKSITDVFGIFEDEVMLGVEIFTG